jgi:hypothetical protein
MNRREFMAGSAAAAVATATVAAGSQAEAQQGGGRECYELKTLTFASREALNRYAAFVREALIPAAKRSGFGPVGLFGVADKPESLDLYVVTAYPNLRAYATAETRMLADAEFQKAGASVLDLPATDPPYARAESSLMMAFEGWPKLKPPKEAEKDGPRVFELRIYESHSRKANKKKIEMFNAGEIGIFDRAGFQPVFFGETLSGPQIPNLTYMVTYSSLAERGSYWQKFLADPEKARLFAIPEYADKLIVSKIRSVNLKPLAGSQI